MNGVPYEPPVDSKTKIQPINEFNVYENNNLMHAIKSVEKQHLMSQQLRVGIDQNFLDKNFKKDENQSTPNKDDTYKLKHWCVNKYNMEGHE